MVRLALDVPPNGRSPGGGGGRSLAIAAAALLVGLVGGFWLGRLSVRRAPPPPAPRAATEAPRPAPSALEGPSALASTAAAAHPLPAPDDGTRRLSAALEGSLEESIAGALPAGERALAPELTAMVNRILVWDLRVAVDGRRGDRLDLLWSPAGVAAPGLPAPSEPTVLALRYASAKLGGEISAYRFEPKGARFARYYRSDGSEVELRLVDSPLTDYEQITSLLKDGRRHKGVDFKTPVGSPVAAPFDGVIERRNWNFAGNGNCLDIRDPATGRHVIFLHLDVLPRELSPGRKVTKGEVIASSGNSGHSFAPHLHYQLEDATGKVLDPFAVLRTERRSLPGAEKASFEQVRAQLDARMAR